MPDVVEITEEHVVVTEVVTPATGEGIVSQGDEAAVGPQGLEESVESEDSEEPES